MAFRYIAAVFAVFFLVEIYFLPSLLSLDFSVQQWIQGQRTCDLDFVAVALQEWTRSQYLPPAIVALVASILFYGRRWEDMARFCIVVAGGALICELAKFSVIRPRPSVLSFVLDGNSFPSGHVANGLLLLAGAYSVLPARSRGKKWFQLTVGTLIGAAILVIAWQRLYLGRHWLTDVVGSLILGFAWIAFVIARWRNQVTIAACVGPCLFVAIAFFILWLIPTLRIRVPSPLTVRGQPVARVDFASPTSNDLKADQWSAVWQELGLPIRTMTRRESTVYLRLPVKKDYMLALGTRPRVNPKITACNRLEILLNDHSLETITLYEGWRDVNVVAPKNIVISGSNELTFRVHGDEPVPAIFMYVEAFPQEKFFNALGLQAPSFVSR